MGATVNIGQAKAQCSALLARAAAGERIVIARGGRPIAVLAPPSNAQPPRVPGHDPIVIHGNFDDPLPEFEASE